MNSKTSPFSLPQKPPDEREPSTPLNPTPQTVPRKEIFDFFDFSKTTPVHEKNHPTPLKSLPEKKEVFEIIKTIYYNYYVRKKIIKNINYRFKNAIEAIYENDLEKFVCFFKWLKQGEQILEKHSHNRYTLTSLDEYQFE